jgi:glycosyltransferase involved in cell wall biosynthesis
MGSESMGVSVIICCHNSASRLPETLRHLAAQHVPNGIPWEVVVVDNASTDETREVALREWPASAPARLRVVAESRPGLRLARERGQAESCWPIISFIDDDNWVGPDWVRLVSEILSEHPEVGACGGWNKAVCEVPAPPWFEPNDHCYAVGPQAEPGTENGGSVRRLWGAGLNIRRAAWDGLVKNGYRPLLMDREGKRLTAGGDSELCHALRLAGWQLWYDPRLTLKHFIPAGRLRWTYLRALVRGFGATLTDPYWFEVDERFRALPGWRRSWLMLVARELRVLPRWLPGWWRGLGGRGEGDPSVLGAERAIGRWSALLRACGEFDERCQTVREAAWRRSGPRQGAAGGGV